ncbi:MAG: thiol peroxidase [Nitrospira sp.]|nr:thiol peroxidase [Nitrospira sp.]
MTICLMSGISLCVVIGCTTTQEGSHKGFIYKDLPVTHKTVSVGEGTSVTLHGKNFALSGNELKLGDTLRNVQVASKDLSLVDIAQTKGKVRIISVVPSIDTKVCEQQTHYLSEKNEGLDQEVELLTVSIDTPFAQDRFAKEANIHNVTFYSDYRGGEFGKSHGLFIQQPHILSRAVMVVDKDNVIRYLQVTPELAELPDMEAAFEAARSLIKQG